MRSQNYIHIYLWFPYVYVRPYARWLYMILLKCLWWTHYASRNYDRSSGLTEICLPLSPVQSSGERLVRYSYMRAGTPAGPIRLPLRTGVRTREPLKEFSLNLTLENFSNVVRIPLVWLNSNKNKEYFPGRSICISTLSPAQIIYQWKSVKLAL